MVLNRDNVMISVIMPVYNDKDFLPSAIESILGQSYDNYELIIVDSSNDLSIWDGIDLQNPRIRYFWIEKSGIANALNYGIQQAHGEYIARMDADDISLPDRFKKQVEFMEDNREIMMLGTEAELINEKGHRIGSTCYSREASEIKCALIFRNAFCHPSVMFRREIFEDLEYSNQHVAEDYDLWTKIALKYPIINLQEKLVYYRVYSGNTSRILRKSVSRSVVRSARTYIEKLFQIDLSEFEIDSTCQYKDLLEGNIDFPSYIVNQIKLMMNIWETNLKGHMVEEIPLKSELNQRWGWNISRYYWRQIWEDSYMPIFDFSRYSNQQNAFFLDDIYSMLSSHNIEKEQLFNQLYDCLFKYESNRNRLLSEKKTYLIYGLGARGKRFISGGVFGV